MFHPLNIEQITEIVKMQMGNLGKLLSGYNMELDITGEAVDWLAEHGFDPQSGARPVKRLIQKEIVNELSKELISGRVSRDSVVRISVENGRLKFASGKP